MRRHLDEVPLNPLLFNPDLPEGFCDVIAAMMDKNHETRTPTAAAVIELLRPWCDERATRLMAESGSSPSGSQSRGGAPVGPSTVALQETASYSVLDDLELPANPLESPSQISQRTVSITSDTEDTLAGVQAPRRSSGAPRQPAAVPATRRSLHKTLLWSAALLAAGAALGAWLAGIL
jgi:hypothetical protein